jgi:BirA family biotin operon repressor/biotin-[acetyl-CoA-carboxylase] ligase
MMIQPYDKRLESVKEVLLYLKKSKSRFSTSKEISGALNLDRQLIYENISYLRDCGYEIEAGRNRGYRLINSPDNLNPFEISAGLKCKLLANRIFSFKSIDSTNAAAHQYAKDGLPEGTMVIAEAQTKGRGRLGRLWHSPPARGLYFSVILRPPQPPDRLAGLSLMTGLALIRAITDFDGIAVQMKWPNDILYRKKKLAGILVELVAELDRVEYVIVGIGINVNHEKKDFPLRLQRKSTSLRIITGDKLPRIPLLQKILAEFESLYHVFCRSGFKYIGAELVKHSAVIGHRVTLRIGRKRLTGKAVGFDDTGGLLLKTRQGLRSYSAGEVTLR